MKRIGLVVHPRREIASALATLQRWCDAHRVALVQVPATGQERSVAPEGDPAACDLIVALGGDGTTLAAIRTGAAAGRPVLGVACGSLGALTAVHAGVLDVALDRVTEGDWTARRLPALVLESAGEEPLTGVNDIVLVRHGAGQVAADVSLDGELYIRFAGDGLVVATALGSSAYNVAAGGPVLAPGSSGFACTPLAPHGGFCPPLVAEGSSRLTVELEPGFGGARIELDGRIEERLAPLDARTLTITRRPDHATLVMLGGEESALAGLRRRRVLLDSPRILARDDRVPAPTNQNPDSRV